MIIKKANAASSECEYSRSHLINTPSF